MTKISSEEANLNKPATSSDARIKPKLNMSEGHELIDESRPEAMESISLISANRHKSEIRIRELPYDGKLN